MTACSCQPSVLLLPWSDILLDSGSARFVYRFLSLNGRSGSSQKPKRRAEVTACRLNRLDSGFGFGVRIRQLKWCVHIWVHQAHGSGKGMRWTHPGTDSLPARTLSVWPPLRPAAQKPYSGRRLSVRRKSHMPSHQRVLRLCVFKFKSHANTRLAGPCFDAGIASVWISPSSPWQGGQHAPKNSHRWRPCAPWKVTGLYTRFAAPPSSSTCK